MSAMLTGADIQQLKDYVSSSDGGMQRQAESTVRLNVSHSNLKAKFMEIRLDLHMTIAAVKFKLSSHCGTAPQDMSLTLKDEGGRQVASLGDDSRKLGYYSPQDGYVIHISDLNPHSLSANGWLEDVSKVEKYVMSDEEYNKRANTVRAHKQMKRKDDPEWTAEKEICMRKGLPYVAPKAKVEDDEYQLEAASRLEVGQRCEVDPGAKRGEIKFVGQCEVLPKGFWVGVQYDEPMGKNDGSVKGKRYFQCPDGYGNFLRPEAVKAGDFPPIDEFAFSDGDEI